MTKQTKNTEPSDKLLNEIIDWASQSSLLLNRLHVQTLLSAERIKQVRENVHSHFTPREKDRLIRFAENNGFEKSEITGIKAELLHAAEWINNGTKLSRRRTITRVLGIQVGKEFLEAARDGQVSDQVAEQVITEAIKIGYKPPEDAPKDNQNNLG